MPKRRKIGILALQGNFHQHAALLAQLALEPVLVRQPEEIASLDGLVMPGGESTTMCRLLTKELREAIIQFAHEGKPILGTCAGLILLASRLTTPNTAGASNDILPLGLLDVEVERNAYGPQIHSNFKQIQLEGEAAPTLSVCFIRAPAITNVGRNVQILATTLDGHHPCAVRQQNIVGLAFHPELTQIAHFHRMAFLPSDSI